MSLTVQRNDTDERRDLKTRVIRVTFDDTYASGGETLTPADFGLEYTAIVIAEPSGGYFFQYDYSAKKMKAYFKAAHTHDLFLKNGDQADATNNRVNAATDKLGANTASNITVAGIASGATAHGGVVGVADAAFSEVTASADLSTVTTRVLALGR